MKDSLHSYMKVGIVHFMAFPEATAGQELLDSIKRIAEDEFFSAIEITSIPSDLTGEIASLMKASKLVVGYGTQPILLGANLDLNSPESRQREAAVSRVKTAIDEACSLGVSRLAVLSGPAPTDEKREQAKKSLVDSLVQVCGYAKSKGNLGITLEVFDPDTDKKCLIGSTGDAVQVAREVRKVHPSFGLMIDLSHLPMQRESSEESLRTAKDYLVHAHIGNCVIKDKNHPAYGDKHPSFGIAGSENDVPELVMFLKALLDIGYIGAGKQNIVAFEVKPMSGETPEMVISNAKRTLIEAWARL
ncbi:sugar phosphate isomerase/epimerase family protein [Chloroflexota bacterium]